MIDQADDIPVVTIDGPSSAGKGALSKRLAEKLGWHFLDSGAIYRVLGFALIAKNIPSSDIPAIINVAKTLEVSFTPKAGSFTQVVKYAGQDVTHAIREQKCGEVASKIASLPEVRSILVGLQRSFLKSPGLVADGRDMGTVVFPRAKLKIFLTASIEERAKRRLLQLQEQGINATLDTVLEDLAARDRRDRDRVVSPLVPDADAVIIDNTKLTIDEVLQQVLAHVKNVHF